MLTCSEAFAPHRPRLKAWVGVEVPQLPIRRFATPILAENNDRRATMIRPTPTILLGLTLTSAGLFSLLVPWLAVVSIVGAIVLGLGLYRYGVKR